MSSTVLAENNFLVPNATILVEVVIFFLFLGVLAKWVLPPVTEAVAQRQEAIRMRLVEAEEAKKRLASAEADYQKALADARHEAARIREEAREQGAAAIAEAREQAQREAQGIFEEARRQIEASRREAFEQLHTEIGTLATELAGRVVGEPLTDVAGRDELIERFLADVESETGEHATDAESGDTNRVRAD
jgi:F-type H+-transporting ATPase subunit b